MCLGKACAVAIKIRYYHDFGVNASVIWLLWHLNMDLKSMLCLCNVLKKNTFLHWDLCPYCEPVLGFPQEVLGTFSSWTAEAGSSWLFLSWINSSVLQWEQRQTNLWAAESGKTKLGYERKWQGFILILPGHSSAMNANSFLFDAVRWEPESSKIWLSSC